MSTIVATLKSAPAGASVGAIDWTRATRFLTLAVLTGIVLSTAATVPSVVDALVDAYLEIAVFVAFTLFLVHGWEAGMKTGLGDVLERHQRWQVPIGALLGAFPGCGGAIVAVTQFTRGHLSFGGLVATLTATMGDAMFLLIAAEPMTALLVSGVSIVSGVATGVLLDWWHGTDFLRPARGLGQRASCGPALSWTSHEDRRIDRVWIGVMAVAMVIGIPATVADVDVPALLGLPDGAAATIALAGVALGLVLWAADGDPDDDNDATADATCHAAPSVLRATIGGTNFVLAWVVFAMVGYELVVAALDIDVAAMLAVAGPLVILAAIAVGFIPGCGPQIVVTSLYLSGALPLAAQLGNAISNDGDALFPAIAAAPRAAVVATLYSAVPAVLVGYGSFVLFA